MESGQTPPDPGPPPGGGEAPASEEELRARLEEEMRRVRIQDLLLQSVAGLVNLTARRIAKEDERDLEQARIGIEAIRGLVDLLEPEPQQQVREALSELQMIFARASGEGEPEGEGEGESPPPGEPPSRPDPPPGGPAQGPGGGGQRPEPPPKLWTPGRG